MSHHLLLLAVADNDVWLCVITEAKGICFFQKTLFTNLPDLMFTDPK
jgi:hypothetical protein